ncbi:hypothetical protein FQR65_LT01348 [Abscondita terminalis]|nr:hypothetical protein FQR65_LT01348 [Abscondita terminalis]
MESSKTSLPTTHFRVGNKIQQWLFDGTVLANSNQEIPIKNVISIKFVYKKSGANPPNPKKFKLFYAKRKKKNVWKLCKLTFENSDTNQIIFWVQTIRNELDLSSRPKQLLLFINPYGGKKNGLRIFEKYAKPLFKLAEVDVKVIVSQRRHHIRDVIVDHSFENIDAVASIGGDGTSSELFNGLVLRECRLRGVDPDDVNVELPKCTIPVGIIPGGSTDTTVHGLHGTTDVITAVLHVIMGLTLGLDLATVHNNDTLLQVCSNVTSYGFLGDTAHHSEKLRWMGPSRYEYVGFRKMVKNQGYNGKMSVLSDDVRECAEKCYENCNTCTAVHNAEGAWVSNSGKYFLIAVANMTCSGERNPSGLTPYCHLGDGYLNVLVVYHTNLYKCVRTFLRFTQSEYSISDLPHVEVFRGREFHFEADGVTGRWNCDGEVLEQSDIRVKVHRQLINVYGRGVSRPSK